MGYCPHVLEKREFLERGATHCVLIGEDRDFTDGMIDRLLEAAHKAGAVMPDTQLYIIKFPDDEEELFTEEALRESLKSYMPPKPGDTS